MLSPLSQRAEVALKHARTGDRAAARAEIAEAIADLRDQRIDEGYQALVDFPHDAQPKRVVAVYVEGTRFASFPTDRGLTYAMARARACALEVRGWGWEPHLKHERA